MEELLNKLIEKGWKPFGREYAQIIQSSYRCFRLCDKNPNADKGEKPRLWINSADKRELASKESGLWQFVCENGMCTAGERPYRGKFYEELFPDYEAQTYANNMIIESALCNEEDLEKFLLDNIKIDGE